MDHNNLHRITHKNRVLKKWLIACAVMALVLFGIVISFIWPSIRQDNSTHTLPVDIVKQADFHIYFPSRSLETISLDTNSASYSSNVFIYTLKEENSSNYITITQQKMPDNINVESIVRRPDRKPEKIAIGTLYDISNESKTVYVILTTDNVMLYANPSRGFDPTTTRSIIDSLR